MNKWILGAFCAAMACAPAGAVTYNVNFGAVFDPNPYPERYNDPVLELAFAGQLNFDPTANVDPTTNGLTVTSFNLARPVSYAYCAANQTLIIGNNIYKDRDCHGIALASDTWFIAVGDIFSSPVIYNVVQITAALPPFDGYYTHATRRAGFSIRDANPGPVPEPASWAMLILSFAMLGCVMRRPGASRHVAPLPMPH